MVPDKAKVAIIKARLYELQVNPIYAEMAVHYDTALLPTLLGPLCDNAKVQVRCSLSSGGFRRGCP